MDKKLNSTSSYLQDVTSRLADIEARPLPSNLGELIDAAAAEGGDRIVWNFFEAGETETYEGMRQRVNHLAQRLEGIGIGKGSHDLITGVFGGPDFVNRALRIGNCHHHRVTPK